MSSAAGCRVLRPRGPVAGRVRAPGSKSLANRAIVCAALAGGGTSRICNLPAADDVRVLLDALTQLGVPLTTTDGEARIDGVGGVFPVREARLDLGAAGTAFRFATAFLAATTGSYVLDGTARMRGRPIEPLLEALGALGAAAESVEGNGLPPVRVGGRGLAGGETVVDGALSSQFLSAMLLAAPRAAAPVVLRPSDMRVSGPYVEMTRRVMFAFGVDVEEDAAGVFRVQPGAYGPARYEVEADASAASCLWVLPAVCGGWIEVAGLREDSVQADMRLLAVLTRMGCRVTWTEEGVRVARGRELRGVTADLAEFPDAAPALWAAALHAEGPTTITGASHLRLKESDRIAVLAAHGRALGAQVEERPDGMHIRPGPLRAARLDASEDHRIAMAAAVAGLAGAGVEVLGPECVSKSFPGFWEVLEGIDG